MKNNNEFENEYNEYDEEKFEEEYFKEDNLKAVNVKFFILIGVFAILLIGALVVLTLNKNKNKMDDKELNQLIIENSTNESPSEEINENVETNTPEEASNNNVIKREIELVEVVDEAEEVIPTPTPDKPVMEIDAKDYSKVKFDAKNNLKELEYYFKENNSDAVSDLIHLDRYIAMSYALRDSVDYNYYGDVNSEGKPDGKGVAVYADNQYYYGDWVNGLREGTGIWVHYHIHLKTNLTDSIVYHQYAGDFKGDLPDGQGQDHYEYDNMFLMGTDRYITNYIGEFKAGLVHGEIYCTTTTKDGDYNDFQGMANNGSFEFVSESRDKNKRGPVLTNCNNPDDFLWLSSKENQNIGVSSYISAYKK